MAASYPTSVKAFTTKTASDTIASAHMNDVQAEIVAMETNLLEGFSAYGPVWTCSISPPSIGNGTLTGKYKRTGKLYFFEIALTVGTTTTFGSGAFEFTVPVAAAAGSEIYAALVVDQAPTLTYYPSTAFHTTTTKIVVATAAGIVTGGLPMTFSAGDLIRINGVYEALT